MVRAATTIRSEAPKPPRADGPPRPPRRLEVFGVGLDWVQLTWSALGPGPVSIICDGSVDVLEADGGPGSHLIEGLASGCDHVVGVVGAGIDSRIDLRATTLETPPGEELLRVATVSDVHIGSHATGYLHTIVEVPEPDEPHPMRCLRAALRELEKWGAQHLVIKGDLVDRSNVEHWDVVRDVLSDVDMPIEVIPGNHERSKVGDIEPDVALEAMGLTLVDGVRSVDHAGVRIVMADTTRPKTDWGTLSMVADGILEAADVDGPVFVGLHHQPMRLRVPLYVPPGLPGPEARSFLHALGETNHRVLVTSGHTHRHRRHEVGRVTATEVGSTKDFPGTWAGYHVHEGGIVQTVRRIGEPSCIRWTDFTRRAAAGAWAHWSPGRIESRCFSLTW